MPAILTLWLNQGCSANTLKASLRGKIQPPGPDLGVDDLRLSNTTGILHKKNPHQSAMPFLSGAPSPKKKTWIRP